MNAADSAPPPGRSPEPPRRYLPDIISLEIARVAYEPPTYRYVKPVREDVSEALAFTIELQGELSLEMDETPVLYVGDVALSDAERLDERRVRFLAFPEEERLLEEDAPIGFGWPGHGPEPKVKESRYRYQSPR